VNAEATREVVDFRCEACGKLMGTAHRVINYRHTEKIGTPDGLVERTTDLADGLVVTSQWHQTEEPPRRRVPPVDVEQPLRGDDADLLVWCSKHGMHEVAAADVREPTAEAAATGKRVVVRLPVQH
jgi:hypothetical protein